MENTNGSSTTTVAEGWDGHNVIAVSFADDRDAYRAMTALKELDSQHRLVLREAAVIFRDEEGRVVQKDRAGSDDLPATTVGGLTGLLVGIIGGPLGVLVGGAYGLFVGSLIDLYDVGEADSALASISASARLGHTALLAVVEERSPDVLDNTMAAMDGTVTRRPVLEVEAEIAAAEDAEQKAKHEARKELIRGRQQRDKAAVAAKVTQLKGKLSRGAKRDADADRAAEPVAGTPS